MGGKVGSASNTSSRILFLALTAIVLTPVLTYNAYPRGFAQTEEPSLTMKARGPYYDGDVVNVTGQVNDPNEEELRQYEGLYVNLTHYDPDGKIVMEKAVGILSNGSFSYSLTAEQMWGYQRLTAKYFGNGLNLVAEVKFSVRPNAEQEPDLSQLPKQETYFVLEGQVYRVLYQSEDIGMALEPRVGAIKILFHSSQDRVAILELPRKLIDSKDSEGNDIDFLAYSEAGMMLPVIHIANGSDTRTIMMDYTKPSSQGVMTLYLVGTELAEVKELPALTASLDKPIYEPGDVALLTGSIAIRSAEFPITLDILNASGAVLFSKPISHDYFGDFSLQIPIQSTLAETGNYAISIRSLQRSAVLEYSVGGENNRAPVSLLHVSNPEFMTNGSVATRADVGEQLLLTMRVNNSATVFVDDVEVFLIFEVRDSSNGLTQFIAAQSDTLTGANPAIEIEVPWRPEYESKFEVRTFVIAKQGDDAFVSSVQLSELTVSALEIL